MAPAPPRASHAARRFLLAALLACVGAAGAQANGLGVCRSLLVQPQDALAACTGIIVAKDPPRRDLVLALDGRAALLRSAGETDAALSDLDTAIGLAPNYPFTYFHRAELYKRLGDLDRALPDYDRALERYPQPAMFLIRGHARWAKGDLDGAGADFGEAATRDPSQPFGHIDRGTVYLVQDRIDAAIAEFDAAARIAPTKDVFLKRGMAFERKGQIEEALGDFTEAVALEGSAGVPVAGGDAPGLSSETDKAIEEAEQASKSGTATARTATLEGLAYAMKRDYPRSIVAFDRALRLDPRERGALRGRAIAEQKLGRLDAALADIDAALALAPNDTGALARREKILQGYIFTKWQPPKQKEACNFRRVAANIRRDRRTGPPVQISRNLHM